MKVIELNHISREFKILNRHEGIKGAIKDLFSHDYKYVKAVNNISLNIKEGEIVGFLGPNGAGKSTTIKMMTGVIEPTSGSVNINGLDPFIHRKKSAMNMGVVFGQKSQLWWELPVIESFKLLKEIYKVSDETFNENMELFKSITQIGSLLNIPVKSLSLGQRMLCEILAAFLHNPKVIFLDEPTIGLDFVVKKKIRQFIYDLNKKKNITIIITSHDIGDIEALCERLIIIDKGNLIYDGNLHNIQGIYGNFKTISVKTKQEEATKKVIERVQSEFNDVVTISSRKSDEIGIEVDTNKIDVVEILKFVMKEPKIVDVSIDKIDTETVISKIYERGI